MLYYLSFLTNYFFALNLFNYITFRSAGAILTALILSWFLNPWFIRFLQKKQMTQVIRTDGPKTHSVKSGTPTMGGLLILFSLCVSTLLWCRLDNRFVWLCWITVSYLGALGFADDYVKWKGIGGHHKGLSPTVKMTFQLIFAIAAASYLYIFPSNPEYLTMVNIPYMKNLFLDIGALYICMMIIVIAGSSNAVNLTDGLDGLAIGSLIIAALSYIVFSYVAGHSTFSTYLKIVPVSGAGELVVFLSALVGAGIGFLWYNCHPAQIFMGDTGSLFLGGLLGVIALIIKQELVLVIVGGLFVAEALSVMIQVYSFKIHKRRVFKMAPLHHHFELAGWHESKVVVRFWIISIVLALLALSSLKLR